MWHNHFAGSQETNSKMALSKILPGAKFLYMIWVPRLASLWHDPIRQFCKWPVSSGWVQLLQRGRSVKKFFVGLRYCWHCSDIKSRKIAKLPLSYFALISCTCIWLLSHPLWSGLWKSVPLWRVICVAREVTALSPKISPHIFADQGRHMAANGTTLLS